VLEFTAANTPIWFDGIVVAMPLYIRSIEESERVAIESGMRTDNAVWARRCQILWHSSQGKIERIAREETWDGIPAPPRRRSDHPVPAVRRHGAV